MRRVIRRTDRMHPQRGVDVKAARGSDVRLIHADGRVQRVELAVDVRDAERILIDKRQLPHPGARKRLGRVAPHAAKAEHDHMAAPQPLDGVGPEDHPRAQKLFIHSCFLLRKKDRPPGRSFFIRWFSRRTSCRRPRWP